MQAIKANFYGLAALAILVLLISLFVPDTQVRTPIWVFAYIVWLVSALFVWHHRRAPKRPSRWLLMAVYSICGAALWLGLTSAVSHVVFGSADKALSGFIDLGVALMMAPGFLFIALAGWVRALAITSDK